jgi:hypothetical protein
MNERHSLALFLRLLCLKNLFEIFITYTGQEITPSRKMNIEIKPDYAMDSAVDQGERRVIIDNGSDTLKVGFSGEDWPQVI